MISTDHCDYLLLKAEDASFRDLVFILFNLEPSQASIEFSEPCQKNAYKPLGDFLQRWYICVSLFLQKLLIIFGTPMALSGEMLEWWLNLLSGNGGFFKLWYNILTGLIIWKLNFILFFFLKSFFMHALDINGLDPS